MTDQINTQGQDTTSQVKADEQVKATNTKVETPIVEEPWKKEIAGLNSANSKLQNELKAMKDTLEAERLSKLSTEQQAEEKIKKANAEYESVTAQSIALKKENLLLVNGLSKDFASLISGKTDEEIANAIKVLKDKIESEATVKAEADRNKFFATGGKDIKAPTDSSVKLEFTREELQTREGRELYKKNQPLGAHIKN